MTPTRQILLVDADPDDVRLIREVVESAGLEMHVSADRVSAIEAFRAIAPDLVLIDADAETDGGEDVSRQLRETGQGRAVPIVLIRNSSAATTAGVGPRDASEWLLKPLRAQALLGTFARHFPHAFLTSPSMDLASAPEASASDGTGHPAGGDEATTDVFPGFDSFGEEALGELLDSVFPASDSGSLASSLRATSAPQQTDEPAELASPAVERTVSGPAAEPPRPEPEPALMTLLDPPLEIEHISPPEIASPPSAGPLELPDTPSDSLFDPPTRQPEPPARPLEPPSHQLESSRSVDPPVTPFEPSMETAAPPPHPFEQTKVARGDFLPTSIEQVEEVPLLPVLPAADAVGPVDDSAARPFPERAADTHSMWRHVVREKRAGRRWLLVLALLGALLAVGSYALVNYMSRDTDLRPVPRPDHTPRTSEIEGAGHAQDLAAPSEAGHVSTPPAAAVEAVPQSSAGLEPSLRSPSAQEAADEAQHVVRVEPPSRRNPHARGHDAASDRGASSSRSSGSSSSRTEPNPGGRRSDPKVRLPQNSAGATTAGSAGASAPATTLAAAGGSVREPERPLSEPAAAPAKQAASEGAQPTGEEHGSEGPAKSDGRSPEREGTAANPDPRVAPGSLAESDQVRASLSAQSRVQAPPAPAALSDRPARPAQPFSLPTALSHPQPGYPSEARDLGLVGTVKLLARVGDDGSVISVRVVGSVAPALDRAAVAAVRGWKYRPAQFGDRFVAAWIEESVTFKP